MKEAAGPILSLAGIVVRRGEFELGPVDLALAPGEVAALLGPNGAGKTTLLDAAAGLLASASGEIRLDGRDPAGAPRSWVARRIAVLPQRLSFPFALSVGEVVAQGRWPHLRGLRLGGERDREIVAAALRRTDAAGLRERDVRTLSGGELQRVLLAKALAQEPRVLLLDEPTANLDPGHIVRVLGPLVREVREAGLAVLMASHDLDLACALSDRVVLLDDGRVVAAGPPAEVVSERSLREVYDAPLRVEPHPRTGRPRVRLELDLDGGP